MMELTITSMTPADRLYTYNQSSQLEGQTGCIGHLRGDFGAGKEFYTSWFDHRREYKTDEFKTELDEVVNTLREKNGLLCTRDSMTRFCYQNPEAEFEGNYCAEYGFKVQTPQHTYMLRCNPNYGDYNFYLYAYVSRFLEHHMEKAKQGIRFITPGYKELFRIPDGDHIRIFTGGGETRDRTCRFIDETHFETSGGYSSALYHICEFAERLEQTHGSVIPLRSSLPVQCFSVLPSSGELILLTRGEKGYSPCYDFSTPDAQQNREFANDRNVKNGVTKAQEAAMFAGNQQLDNLCVIVDHNGLQIDGPVEEVNDPMPLADKFRAFKFHVVELADGNDFDQIRAAFAEARKVSDSPVAIIAETVKGKGVSFMENQVGWHGKAPNEEQRQQALKELEG